MSRLRQGLRRILGASSAAPPSEVERRLLGSVLFDHGWYGRQVGHDLDRTEAVRHYLATGVAARLSPHPLFDPRFVRLQWGAARLRRLGERDPLDLYLRRGLFTTPTHPLFDTAGYLERVPDAADHPEGPVAHYVTTGAAAGIPANDWLPAGTDLRAWLHASYETWAPRRVTPVAEPPEPPAPVPGLVSVVVVATAEHRAVADTVAGLRAWGDAGPAARSVEIVVLGVEEDALEAAVLDSLPLRFPGVEVVHGGVTPEQLLGRVRGEVVVRLDGAATWTADWLTPALELLAAPGVAGVQPLLLRRGGAIWSAGVAGADPGHRLLEGFPAEDAAALDGRDLPGLSTEVVVRRAADVRAGSGETGSGRLRLGPVPVVLHPLPATPAAALRGPGASAEELWDAAGLPLGGYDDAGNPVVRRPPASVTEGVPRLRWALKNPAVAGPAGDLWGDTHFADALARALRDHGQEVVVDRRAEHHRPTGVHDDVVLALRGRVAYRPDPGPLALGWVISHPDEVTQAEAASYDRLFAASVVWAERRAQEWGLPIEPLLQATDPVLFSPDRAEPGTGRPLLFVGSRRGGRRPILEWAVEADLPVAVYGGGWEGRLPDGVLAGAYLPNTELGAAYGAAGVVLNDHWDDMRDEGFLSNRLFDAVASGARVVTDDAAGLRRVFGPEVQVARSREDLVRLASLPDPDEVFGDRSAREAAADAVRREHSFARRAEQLVTAALELARARS